MTEQELANVIWDIKEIIRNLYDDAEVEDVILPFTLLRRLDCVLDEKRDATSSDGALVLYGNYSALPLKNGNRVVLYFGDENKLFSVGFRTLPENSTGVFHILEHSVLCGSEKYVR